MVSARNRYIDLLIRCIANTIYGDPSQEPWNENHAYRREMREDGMDWPSIAHSMIGIKRLQNLRDLTEKVLQDGVPGDVIETGVWRGGACILIRGILAAHEIEDRIVFVADSFEGLPPPDPGLHPADAGDTHHTFPQLAIDLDTVKSNFSAYDLLDEQVIFLKGWFNETLPTVRDRQFALIRLDGDMYGSTMDALTNLYDRLSPGGFVIIDDYGAIPACKKAVDDFRSTTGIDAPMTEVDWTGIWWQKPR